MKTLQPHQRRVVDEKAELDGRREKLGQFKNTDVFAALPWQEQERLNTQAHIMTMYSAVLGERIAAFSSGALTDADALADLNGTPRPDSPTPRGAEVYSRPECAFNYCSAPGICKGAGQCVNQRK